MLPIKDDNRLKIFPFWIILIILTNIYVFYLELISPNTDIFISEYALIPASVNLADTATLLPFITSQFLHGGFLHIISNMLFLWVFGNNVEGFFGKILFPVFYLASGVAAGLTQYFFEPFGTIPLIGASGAIAGVLGAYLVLFPTNKIKSLVFIFFFVTVIDIPAFVLLGYWFALQLFSGIASITTAPAMGGVAFLPHIGGFLFGWFTAILFLPKRNYSLT